MSKFPLVGPSYSSQSVSADCQQTVNLYPEQVESGAGNSNIVLYPSPGTKQFVELVPPTPPPVANPDIYNTITWPNTSIKVGNTRVGSFVSGPTILIDDVLFYAVYDEAVPNSVTMSSVVMTYLGNSLGTFSLIEPIVSFSSGPNARNFYIFYCKSLVNIPALGSIDYVITWTGDPTNKGFLANWTCIHHLTTLDKHSSGFANGVTSFSAPAINPAEQEFVLSWIDPTLNGGSVTVPLPFFKFTNNVGGCAAAYRDFGAFTWIAPAGSYAPVWTSNSGAQDVAAVNASFKLA